MPVASISISVTVNDVYQINFRLHCPELVNVTCELEAAMLERSKLMRATISQFLRKCCFSRRSEKRAPSIPRALERNEKIRV